MRRLLWLCLLAACSAPRGESLGRMGGAPPTLILTSGMIAGNGAWLGEATLFEEVQGDRLVLKLNGLPEGRHVVRLHDVARCDGAGFAGAGPARDEDLPRLDVEKDGAAELYADLPGPRLRGAGGRLDADGMAVTVALVSGGEAVPLGCATFRLGGSGATDGD